MSAHVLHAKLRGKVWTDIEEAACRTGEAYFEGLAFDYEIEASADIYNGKGDIVSVEADVRFWRVK
jgi:hypothetical protein